MTLPNMIKLDILESSLSEKITFYSIAAKKCTIEKYPYIVSIKMSGHDM